ERCPREDGGLIMGLFSRRKRTEAEKAGQSEELDARDALDPADEDDDEEGAAQDDDAPEEADRTDAEAAPRGEHLEDGPYDEADAPDEDRSDLGGLQVPTVDGMELRMEVDQRSGAVTGANLVLGGSSLQVQAFAAPKSRGLWEEARKSVV